MQTREKTWSVCEPRLDQCLLKDCLIADWRKQKETWRSFTANWFSSMQSQSCTLQEPPAFCNPLRSHVGSQITKGSEQIVYVWFFFNTKSSLTSKDVSGVGCAKALILKMQLLFIFALRTGCVYYSAHSTLNLRNSRAVTAWVIMISTKIKNKYLFPLFFPIKKMQENLTVIMNCSAHWTAIGSGSSFT